MNEEIRKLKKENESDKREIPRILYPRNLKLNQKGKSIWEPRDVSTSTSQKLISARRADKRREAIQARKDDTMIRLGLDLGTKTIVMARRKEDLTPIFKHEINGFFEFEKPDQFTENLLVSQKIPFIERDGKFYALGSKAEKLAYAFNSTLRRPMADGTVSDEDNAIAIMASIVQAIIGKLEDDAILYYCIPANAINKQTNVQFHNKIAQLIIESYKRSEATIRAFPINEARAIAVGAGKELAISISFGAGMVNVCYSMFGIPVFEFSLVGCLSPDFPVITDKGIKEIQNITPGELVLGTDGKYYPVSKLINNGHRDIINELKLERLPAFTYKLTDNHRVWVKSNKEWGWKECGDLVAGDILGIPTIKFDGQTKIYFGCNKSEKVEVCKSRNLGRFFGYFLGDGSVFLNKKRSNTGCVKLEFNSGDISLINKYSSIINKKFGNKAHLCDRKSEGLVTLKLNNSAVSRYMAGFYRDGHKFMPIPVNEIPDQMGIGIIEGLIDSDGHRTGKWEGGYEITNTSIDLIMLVHHLLNRFNIVHSISKRPPRNGGINSKGRRIKGKSPCYSVVINSLNSAYLDVLFKFDNAGLTIPIPDYSEYVVSSRQSVEYNGDVYDLVVDSPNRSFATFGGVVHNSGDWIDVQSAMRFGYDPKDPGTKSRESPTTICRRKEVIDLTKKPSEIEDVVDKTIILHYQILIENVVAGIINGFNRNIDKARIEQAIPIIIAGGTASPKGFKEYFEGIISKSELPFDISEIIVHPRPLFAVAEGCLVAAECHGDA